MPYIPEQDTVLVHVGFPKALSSWLQKKWFTPQNGFCKIMDPVQVQLQLLDPSSNRDSPSSVAAVGMSQTFTTAIGCYYNDYIHSNCIAMYTNL